MPRKPSKYVERAELDRAQQESTVLSIGLQCVTFETPCQISHVTHDGMRYTFRLYRPTGPHGGILVLSSRSTRPGVLGDYVTVQYFEEWLQDYRGTITRPAWHLAYAQPVTELTHARYLAEQAERAEQQERHARGL